MASHFLILVLVKSEEGLMPTIKIFASLTVDDVMVQGFPLVFEREVEEVSGMLLAEKEGDANATDFSPTPVSQIQNIQVLCLQAKEGEFNFRLQGGEEGSEGVNVAVNGFILLGGVVVEGGDVQVNNPLSTIQRFSSFAAGEGWELVV